MTLAVMLDRTCQLANGCAIAWWRRLLKGATIKDLHRSWTFSTSIKDAVFAGKYVNVIALAALTAKLTIIDGILMQEATRARIREDHPIDVRANIFTFGNVSTSIPVTGSRKLDIGGNARSLSPGLSDALKIWANSGPLLSHGLVVAMVIASSMCLLQVLSLIAPKSQQNLSIMAQS